MSARRIVAPVYVLNCDGCPNVFRGKEMGRVSRYDGLPYRNDDSDRSVRRAAELAGWKIRPWAGKGSRTAPDLCPTCAAAGGAPC